MSDAIPARIPIGKRLRFEVFKRDGFKCMYCGAHPPHVLLECDHIEPVSLGGTNDESNLVTACQDCNRGKSNVPLSDAPISLREQAALVEERESQIRGYEAVMREQRERINDHAQEVLDQFCDAHRIDGISQRDFESIKHFVQKLGLHEVVNAMSLAISRKSYSRPQCFKYFCGICWNLIREKEGDTLMARIRSIHPGLFTDEAFMTASAHARLLVIGIWCEAWDDGVFEWKPLTLKARLFPADTVSVADLLSELAELDFIRGFDVDGKSYGVIRNFQKYQRPKKPNSSGKLPNDMRDYAGASHRSSEPVPDQFGTGGEKSPQMEDGGGRRRDIPESKSSTTNVRSVDKPTRPAADEKFEEFWRAYPHRGDAADPKKPAREKFDRAVKRGVEPDTIIVGAKRFAEIERRAGRAGTEKCAQAVTWLNQDRWQDYQPAPADQQPASVFVARGSEEWDAWARHRGKQPISKFYPEHRAEGWYFPTRLPPSIEKAA